MKRLFKNVNTFGLLGMLVMGLLVFTQSAFKGDAKHVDSTYYFTGNSSDDIGDPLLWTQTEPGFACGTDGELPCRISVPANESLESYLSETDPGTVTANALTKKFEN